MTDAVSRPLRVLIHPDDVLRQERAARGARIDKLSVDRSRWAGAVMPRWSAEAEDREPRFAALRAELTLADQIAAWRQFFAMTVPKKEEQLYGEPQP